MRKKIYNTFIFNLFSLIFLIGCKEDNNDNPTKCENPNPPQNNDLILIEETFGQKPNYNGFNQLIKVEEGFFFRRLNNIPKISNDRLINDLLFESGSNSIGLLNNYGQIVWEKTLNKNIIRILPRYDYNQNETYLVAVVSDLEPANVYFEKQFEVNLYNSTGNLVKNSTISFNNEIAVRDIRNYHDGIFITGSYREDQDNYPYLIKTNKDYELDTLIVFKSYKGNWANNISIQGTSASPTKIINLIGSNQNKSIFILNVENNLLSPEVWDVRYSKEYTIDNNATYVNDVTSAGVYYYDVIFIVGSYNSGTRSKPFAIYLNGNGDIVWQNKIDYSGYNDVYKSCFFDSVTGNLITSGYHSHGSCEKRYGNGLISILKNGEIKNHYTFGDKNHDSEIMCLTSDNTSIFFGGYINENSNESGTKGWFGAISK
jgi:hypothetical protein